MAQTSLPDSDPLTFIWPPASVHAVSLERDTRQFRERFRDVEITERADFEERHVVLGCVDLSRHIADFPLVGEVKSVPYQDLGYAGGMLRYRRYNL